MQCKLRFQEVLLVAIIVEESGFEGIELKMCRCRKSITQNTRDCINCVPKAMELERRRRDGDHEDGIVW